VGRVLARLDELGLRDDTLVIFTSDNGGLSTSEGSPTSNLPLRAGKGWLYEGGIRVPLLVRWPGVLESGRVIRTPVISTDFFPTLLEAARLPARPDQHRDGISFVPALRGKQFNPDRALFWHYPHYGNQGGTPGAAIRRGDWKLIEFFEDDRVELFNLRRDLGEQDNLAAAHPRRVRDLRRQLRAWQGEVDALRSIMNPEHATPTP
jgi:arylsulfatase A-like enzyme